MDVRHLREDLIGSRRFFGHRWMGRIAVLLGNSGPDSAFKASCTKDASGSIPRQKLLQLSRPLSLGLCRTLFYGIIIPVTIHSQWQYIYIITASVIGRTAPFETLELGLAFAFIWFKSRYVRPEQLFTFSNISGSRVPCAGSRHQTESETAA